MEEIRYEVKFLDEALSNQPLDTITEELENMFTEVLDVAGRNYDEDDRIRLSIMQNALDEPIIIHLAPRYQVNAGTVMDR